MEDFRPANTTTSSSRVVKIFAKISYYRQQIKANPMDEPNELPRAVITRLIKQSLPENVKMAKDAKLAVIRAAKVFILYVTACANDFSRSCNRTTIGVNHIFGALEELEFKEFNEKLKKAFEEYKKEQQSKKQARKKSAKEGEMSDNETKSDAPKNEPDEKESK
jgi:DNA polymerase epsilon subunit 3